MPELPEVETVCRGLRPFLKDQQIISVRLNRPDLRFPFPENFAPRLEGQTIQSIDRRGKYVLINLESGLTLIIHLGMSGQVQINPPDTHKHDHVVMTLTKGQLTYRDPRRFGFMHLVSSDKLESTYFKNKLGIEPLEDDFNGAYLFKALRSKAGPIKPLLLNQPIVAGLGNIYVCEALFYTRIHPQTPGKDLSEKKLSHLCVAIKEVLHRAIASGGSSLRDHLQVDGKLGYFQHQFKVYGKEKQPCSTCDHPIKRMVQSGRSTFYCETCQPLLRHK